MQRRPRQAQLINWLEIMRTYNSPKARAATLLIQRPGSRVCRRAQPAHLLFHPPRVNKMTHVGATQHIRVHGGLIVQLIAPHIYTILNAIAPLHAVGGGEHPFRAYESPSAVVLVVGARIAQRRHP